MPTDTCKLTKVGHEAILWLIWTLSPHKVHCARAACVCMCMDAHVPSHWDICGNCESAVMAKLAIKLCQGRDPSEGCNVYHRVLAQTPLSRGTWLFQQSWNLAPLKGCESESEGKKIFWPSLCCFFVFLWFHPSLMQPSIQAQVCVYCSSCPEVVNLCWWGGDRVKHRSQNTRSGRYCYCTDINSSSICTLPPSIYFLDNFQICTFSPHILTQISLLLLLTFFTTGSFL